MLHLNWLICGYFAYVITSIRWLCVGYFDCISILRLYEFHTSVFLNHKQSLYIIRNHEAILKFEKRDIHYIIIAAKLTSVSWSLNAIILLPLYHMKTNPSKIKRYITSKFMLSFQLSIHYTLQHFKEIRYIAQTYLCCQPHMKAWWYCLHL